MQINSLPSKDGEITEYLSPNINTKAIYFNKNKKVIFINGMLNKDIDHKNAALGLSLVLNCVVIGVYNKTHNAFFDILECIGDKMDFHLGEVNSVGALGSVSIMKKIFRSAVDGKISNNKMKKTLDRNPATLSLYHLLRKSKHRYTPIHAHSQGNLILSNALTAVFLVDGKSTIKNREIYTYGSPTSNWPPGIKLTERAYEYDFVSWMSLTQHLKKSRKGFWKGSTSPFGIHEFNAYIDNDSAFTVNNFAVKNVITFNLNEEGLAKRLLKMGINTIRVNKVFKYLISNHYFDADDVAYEYVNELRALTKRTNGNHVILTAVRMDIKLKSTLINILSGGMSSFFEKDAIRFLSSGLRPNMWEWKKSF